MMPLHGGRLSCEFVSTQRSLELPQHVGRETIDVLRSVAAEATSRQVNGSDDPARFPVPERVLVDAEPRGRCPPRQ